KNPRDPIPYSGEVVRKDKSGNPRIIQFARDPIYDEDKKLTGFVISEQDITEKRRQEEFARQRELRQSELAQLGQFALRDTNILSIFEESARIIERVFNMDACCLYRWDEQRKALKRGGHSGKLEIPWEKHIDNLPADWAEGVFETMLHMTILPAGKLVIPAVSGALGASPVVMGLEILLGTPEQPFGLLGMYYKGDAAFTPDDLAFLDTLRTFLHQSVERLNAMENLRLFSDAVQTSMEGIHITDLNGRIFFANQMADIILGYNIGGQLGRNIRELVTDSTDRDAIYNTLSKNGAWKGEVDVLSRSGKIIPVFLSAVLILNNMRKIIGMLVVFRDIGEEKARKKELIEAKEAAESAARTKSEFLATMSHEIRTPMNGVIGMTNLLLETELSAEQQEYLETLRSSGESLLTIINDILDFSKIEAGKIELEKHPFQLSSCVEEVVDLLATKADEKQLDLMYYLDPALPGEVVGDVTRVRQILVNLVGNAIKFTPNGEIRIYVDKTGSAKAPRMRFRVEDTGIGIPEDKRDRLFKSFSQVDASTRRKYGGTGMGLAISKRLTTLMGGEMEVESGEGKGSIFSFSLPLIAGQALDSQKDVAGKENFVDGKSLLLVVSSKHHRKILSRVLGAAGAKVTPVASGPDAFARLGKGNFDGIILDYDVATGDPFAFIRELRGGPAGSTLPLLMFSSLRNSNHTLLEFPGTVQRILPKPFRHGQFLRAVGELFHQGRGADPTRAKLVKHIDETMARKYPLSILLAEDNMVNQKLAVRMLAKMGYRSDVA
ncbi:MAG TPA: ATP-binding protein, partial [Calditrichia bacterium]|nr:ATP-binding protein [Calditrichia bacterium]